MKTSEITTKMFGFQPFSIATSILATQYFVIPFYDNYFQPKFINENSQSIEPIANYTNANFYYNPLENHVVNICFFSAFFGYWSMSLLCTFMDLLPLKHWKTQDSRSYFTLSEWLQAVSLSNINLIVFSWVITLPLMYFWFHLQRYRGENIVMNYAEREFNMYRAPFDMLVHIVTVDVWFYITHRILHYPFLYKLIHKLHHRFKAPTAVACMYANPIEFTIGNHLGVALGPVFSNCHPYTAFFWFFLSLFNTAGAHSGYHVFAAKGHDIHHEKFKYNFGVGGMMDFLCGTRYVETKKD